MVVEAVAAAVVAIAPIGNFGGGSDSSNSDCGHCWCSCSGVGVDCYGNVSDQGVVGVH